MSVAELSDWKAPKFGAESSASQRRRIVSTTRVEGGGVADVTIAKQLHQSVQRAGHYSVAADRSATTYSSTITESAARPRDARVQRNRAEGGTWSVSEGLRAALSQSGTTIADSAPMQRNISEKVVIDKIQQPKQVNVNDTAVKLEGTRVRGVGYR